MNNPVIVSVVFRAQNRKSVSSLDNAFYSQFIGQNDKNHDVFHLTLYLSHVAIK